MKALGDVLGYRSGGNDGDGIVGGAQVGNADECGDTQFCTSLAFYVTLSPSNMLYPVGFFLNSDGEIPRHFVNCRLKYEPYLKPH